MNELDASAKTIFLEAVDQPSPEERAAFLEATCGGDAALRARVMELLRAHEGAGNFLGGGPSHVEVSLDGGFTYTGKNVGPYKLVEEIGEGGFGIVYLAEQQEPLRRRVALKIIKPGMDTRQVIARFAAERQALAMMDHPNIARVLDAGQTDAGRPYFVMELVKGVPITRYCDEHRLTPRERLALFVPVCQAVQHAHQKGIIHRDLKPSNIVVTSYDGQPVPKVIDFGVAKALGQSLTERTLVTGFGSIVGTLEYMSPEQAEFNSLDVDTRADIYSLGAVLYELLTGTTPISRERLMQSAVTEVLRLIREEEPATPSTRISQSKDSLATISAQRKLEPARLTRELRGDLDWIVMRCLEKDRTRRYETANGLARDIERYLSDEVVEASPPSRWYRSRKFARKNRRLIGTSAAFVVLLAAGAGISIWQAVRARGAERRAISARDREAEQNKQAKRSEARAQAVLKFFQDKVLAAARPKGQEGGVSREATIREALDQAEPEISRAFAGEPLVEASIRNTLGVSYWYLGAQDQALRQQERALVLRRRELGSRHPDTAGIMNDVSNILFTKGKYQEAQKLLEEVVDVKRRTSGPEDPSTLRSANNLAVMMALRGEYEDAVKLAEDTLKIQRRVDGPETIFTLRSAYNVAVMRRHLGQLDLSRALFEETLQTLRRIFGVEHQDTLRVMDYLGELLLDQGQPAEARKLFEQALQAQRHVLGATHDETLLTIFNLAETAHVQGRLDDARKLAEEAVELHKKHLGSDHPQTLQAVASLAAIHRDQGRLAEAKKEFEEAITGLRRSFSAKTPELQRALNAYAWMLATAADPAYRDPRRAVELAQEVVQNIPRIQEIWTTEGAAYYYAGNWKEAIAAIERSEKGGRARLTAINALFSAMAYWQLGEKEKARHWFEAADRVGNQGTLARTPELACLRREASRLLGMQE